MFDINLREFSYISNILSTVRILLAAPIYYCLSLQTETGNYLAVFLMCVAAVTDAYDGRLARRLQQKSDLGRILDPVADKICMGVIALTLVHTHDLPLWFLLLVVGRDLGIVVLGLLLSLRSRHVVESNMIGKVTVNALALTVIAYTLDWGVVKDIALWLSVALLGASSISYMRTLVRSASRN